MSRALLLVVLLALIGSAPAAASPRDRCPHRPGEKTLARSTQAVVTERERDETLDDDAVVVVHAVIGCSRATGRRRVVVSEEVYDAPGDYSHGIRLAGTAIAYLTTTSSKVVDTSSTTLITDDAVHRHRRHVLDQAFESTSALAAYRPGADGTVAWLHRSTSGDRLRVWRARTGARTVDSGFTLRGPVRLAADGTVRWLHGGVERQAPVSVAHDACPHGPRHDGTDAVDTHIEAKVLTACLRATGTTVRVPMPASSSIADVAGPYLALTRPGAIVRVDLRTGTTETIPTRQTAAVVVDPAGSLAWADPDLDPTQPARTRIWVRDAGGDARQVATVDSAAVLVRDDRTVVVTPGRQVIVLNP